MTHSQKDALDEARIAFKAGSYFEALEKYEYFFDHALDGDPASLYGVRLSYCLNEWSRLGQKFPPAKIRLQQKREEALSLLHETRDPERFHDYIAICKYLGCTDLPVEQFLGFHNEDEDLASIIVRFIWNQLVERGLWKVCMAYLNNPREKYDTCMRKFDQAMAVCKSDETLGGKSFESQIKGWYIKDVSNILLVLKNCAENEKFNYIRDLVTQDLESRGYIELEEEINGRVGL